MTLKRFLAPFLRTQPVKRDAEVHFELDGKRVHVFTQTFDMEKNLWIITLRSGQ